MNYQGQVENCGKTVEKLEIKVDVLEEKLRKSDSTLARAAAKLEILNGASK